MVISIFIIMLLICSFSLIANVLSNLARIEEMRALKRELRRYEKAFRSVKVVIKYIKSDREIPEPGVKIHVVDETKKDDLPKFGDE